jgi:hypothetical protein
MRTLPEIQAEYDKWKKSLDTILAIKEAGPLMAKFYNPHELEKELAVARAVLAALAWVAG